MTGVVEIGGPWGAQFPGCLWKGAGHRGEASPWKGHQEESGQGGAGAQDSLFTLSPLACCGNSQSKEDDLHNEIRSFVGNHV